MRRSVSTLAAAGLVTAGLLLLTGGADAHHSNAPFFDPDRTVEIQGVVTKWVFMNPHPLLYVEVTDDSGQKVEWLLQFTNINRIRRMGVTEATFPVGMEVTARGNPSRAPGTYGMNTELITLPDGTEIRAPAGG